MSTFFERARVMLPADGARNTPIATPFQGSSVSGTRAQTIDVAAVTELAIRRTTTSPE